MMKEIETRKVEQVADLIPDEKSWKNHFFIGGVKVKWLEK